MNLRQQTLINIYIKQNLTLIHIINLKTFPIEKLASGETLFWLKMLKNLHTSFAVMTHSVEGLRFNALLAERRKFSQLPCRYTNTGSAPDRKAVYFSLENINKE
jgi:hypothetical protein